MKILTILLFSCFQVFSFLDAWTFQPGEKPQSIEEKIFQFPVNELVDQRLQFIPEKQYLNQTGSQAWQNSYQFCQTWSKPFQLALKPAIYSALLDSTHHEVTYHFSLLTKIKWLNAAKQPINYVGTYQLELNQFGQLATSEEKFFFQSFERMESNEQPGIIVTAPEFHLKESLKEPFVQFAFKSGLNLAASLKTFQKWNTYGLRLETETYLTKFFIKINCQTENLDQIPVQYQELIDSEVTSDLFQLRQSYLTRLQAEVFPKLKAAYPQTTWNFKRFETECQWTAYDSTKPANTLNFVLHALDLTKPAKINFQLFVAKRVEVHLHFSKHQQITTSPEAWKKAIQTQVENQGYPPQWFNFQLQNKTLTITSQNPEAFHLTPLVLTYETVQTDRSSSDDSAPNEALPPVPKAVKRKRFDYRYLYFLLIPTLLFFVHLTIIFYRKRKIKKRKC